MITFALSDDYVPLCNLLQLVNLCSSGGEAKQVIAAGQVTVNGNIETRKRCKIVRGRVVVYNGEQITIT